MSNPAYLATAISAADHVDRILLVGRVMARLARSPYGYGEEQARATARQMVAERTVDEVLAFLGDIEGCSNCYRVAIAHGRCVKCQHLPSDND